MPAIRLRDGMVDLDRRVVRRAGAVVALTDQEARLLLRLVDEDGEVVPRGRLLVEVMGYRSGVRTRALENAVMRLRAKIEVDPDEPELIVTVRGVGYRLALLRAPDTALIGRETDLARIEAAIARMRLVTLWGPGGVGKTALAAELARRRPSIFVDLREATDATALTHDVARALGVDARSDPVAEVGAALALRTETLLVLDDFDALVAHAAIVDEWSRQLPPGSAFLVTSRERLRLPHEEVVSIAPLEHRAAMELFERRSGPATGDAEALVSHLDGLPLAIELAAAWMDLVSPRQLLDRLEERIRVLAARTDRSEHHGTMEAALDASWVLLDPAEQQALAQSSLFAGGFDLAAAEAVWSLDTPDRWPLEVLGRLRDKALVTVDAGPRYRLLQTIRSYAAWRLGKDAPAEDRHADHYLRWALAHDGDTRAIESERDNVLVAARRVLPRNPALAARLLGARHGADWWFTPPRAALARIEAVERALRPDDHAEAARMAWMRGQWLSRTASLQEADAAFADGLDRARRAGHVEYEAGLLRMRGLYAMFRGDLATAIQFLEAALDAARRAGAVTNELMTLQAIGDYYEELDDISRARVYWANALQIAQAGKPTFVADPARGLCRAEIARGHLEQARAYLELAIAADAPSGATVAYGHILDLEHQGWLRFVEGEIDAAEAVAVEMRDRSERAGDASHAAAADGLHAYARWARGDHAAARALLERARDVFRSQDRGREAQRIDVALWALDREVDRSVTPPPDGPDDIERRVWLAGGAHDGDLSCTARVVDALLRTRSRRSP